VQLSWDLFILVFFAVVVAYSFIIGRNQTLKVILGTYVAILCADGIGNLFAKYLAPSEAFLKLMKLFSIGSEDQAVIFFKVLIFLVLIVLIAVRGMFQVDSPEHGSMSIRIVIVLLLGLMSAGLMMSAVLVFVSGASLIGSSMSGANILSDVYNSSRLVRIMVDFANIWFLLPGIAFIVLGILHKKSA
jgi:hypothetical protein